MRKLRVSAIADMRSGRQRRDYRRWPSRHNGAVL